MEKEWYVVNTYSGHESKVKEKLEMRAESMGFKDNIFRIIVPEKTVKETMKDGSIKEFLLTVGTDSYTSLNAAMKAGYVKKATSTTYYLDLSEISRSTNVEIVYWN